MLVKEAYLREGARLGEQVVDGISGDPDHAGQGHAEAHPLGPLGVFVVVAVCDRGVGDDVEDEDKDHDSRGEVFPAEIPELVGFVSGHLLNAVAEPLRSEHPADGDSLEEANPEERHAGAGVEVHQLEHIDSTLK